MSTRPSTDPRVVRTRRRLKRALFELMDEVGYEAITVGELARRADVARSTFYTHYGEKEDLLFDGFEEWLSAMRAPHEGGSPPAPTDDVRRDPAPGRFHFALPLLRHAATLPRFFRNTIVRGRRHYVRRRLKEVLARVALREMEMGAGRPGGEMGSGGRGGPSGPRDPELAEGRARAVAGALLGVLEWWFENGLRLEPREVDGVFQDVVAGVWRTET